MEKTTSQPVLETMGSPDGGLSNQLNNRPPQFNEMKKTLKGLENLKTMNEEKKERGWTWKFCFYLGGAAILYLIAVGATYLDQPELGLAIASDVMDGVFWLGICAGVESIGSDVWEKLKGLRNTS